MGLDILIIGAILGVVQISIFHALPFKVRMFLCAVFVFTIAVNFALSLLIFFFTGAGNTVGTANLFGSVVFGLYLWYLKNTYNPRLFYRDRSGRFYFLFYDEDAKKSFLRR